MPNGFSGNAAVRYIGHAATAHTRALGVAQQEVPQGAPRMVRVREFPFTPEAAITGRFVVGRGDSSNIVVNQEAYDQVARMISSIDDHIGECIYRTAAEIEEMCRSIFVLPTVSPECLNFCNTVKTSMGNFRGLTEDAALATRSFAREITEIGLD